MIDIEEMRADIRRDAILFSVVTMAAGVILFGIGIGIGYLMWAG